MWLYAAHNPELKAGVRLVRSAGRPADDAAAEAPDRPGRATLKAPVLGLYGGADTGIPIDSVEKMRGGAEGGRASPARSSSIPTRRTASTPTTGRATARTQAEDGWKQPRPGSRRTAWPDRLMADSTSINDPVGPDIRRADARRPDRRAAGVCCCTAFPNRDTAGATRCRRSLRRAIARWRPTSAAIRRGARPIRPTFPTTPSTSWSTMRIEIVAAAGYDGRRFHLVGHDWGGQVSWGVAVGASRSDSPRSPSCRGRIRKSFQRAPARTRR